MTTRFLTIAEAEQLTGKSAVTLRRFIRQLKDAGEPDYATHVRREAVEEFPSQHRWKISEELLQQRFADDIAKAKQGSGEPAKSASPDDTPDPTQTFVETLRDELREKNAQIRAQNDFIRDLGSQLNERLRESNVLMKGLQDRLALPSSSQQHPVGDHQRSAAASSDNGDSRTVITVDQPAEPAQQSKRGRKTPAKSDATEQKQGTERRQKQQRAKQPTKMQVSSKQTAGFLARLFR